MERLKQLQETLITHYKQLIRHKYDRNWKLFMVMTYDKRQDFLIYSIENDIIEEVQRILGNHGAEKFRKDVEYSLKDCYNADKDIDPVAYNARFGYTGASDLEYTIGLIQEFCK